MTVEIVKSFFEKLDAKDVDGALTLYTDEAVVESPMGPQHGKLEIAEGLRMMVSMPSSGEPPALVEEGDTIVASVQSPMGPIKLIFSFSDGLISHQAFRMG